MDCNKTSWDEYSEDSYNVQEKLQNGMQLVKKFESIGSLTNFNEIEKVPKYEMVFSLIKSFIQNIP